MLGAMSKPGSAEIVEALYTLDCAIAALDGVSAWNHADNTAAFENAAELMATAKNEIAAACAALGIPLVAMPESPKPVGGWLSLLRGVRAVEALRASSLASNLRRVQTELRALLEQ
jgi:hypothetical protein